MGTITRSKAAPPVPVSFSNIVDTGTEGTKVATGTTEQRGSTTGQWRYNSTTGFFEGRNTSGEFLTLEPTPTVTGVDVTEVDSTAGGNQTFVITGTNFSSGGVIAFVGSSAQFDASSTTHDSGTQQTAVAPKASFLNAQEPYKVKFTSSGGVAGTSASGLINVDSAPTWTTASGNIANIYDNATGTHATVIASDAEGDTIAYTETGGTVLSGQNLTLNSSTGAISGDPTDVAASTTHTFDLRATAGIKTADRSFNIIINPTLDGSSSAKAATSIANLYDYGVSNGLIWFKNANINSGNAFQIRYASYNNKGWLEVLYSQDSSTDTPRTHWLNQTQNYTRPQMYDYNLSSGGLNYSSGSSSFIKLHSSLGLTDVAFTTKSSKTADGVAATGQNLGGHYPLIASTDIIGTDASTIKTQLVNYFGGYGEGFHASETGDATSDYQGGWRDPSNTNDVFEIVLCYRGGAQNCSSGSSEWHIVDGDSSATSTGGTYASNYGYRESGSYPAANVGTMANQAGTRHGISSSNVMSIWVTDE
jgi:hypothetical protein